MSYRVTPKRHRSSFRNIPSPKKTSELSNISLVSKVSGTRNGLKTTRNYNYSSPINMKHESCMLPQKKPDYNIDERLKGIKDKLENANKRHLQSLVLKQNVSRVSNDYSKLLCLDPSQFRQKMENERLKKVLDSQLK